MKKRAFILVTVLGFLLIGIIAGFKTDFSENSANVQNDSSFAVVELFTSEGCSSCPPADKLLHNIIEDARENNKRIFALAFHVDYWNYLGWKDIYGKPAYSQRQKEYAEHLSGNIYTPQIIINGEADMVGSNRSKVLKYIGQALTSSTETPLSIHTEPNKEAHTVMVEYHLNKLLPGSKLNIALVEKGIVRKIKNGENGGRTLHHDNVVRAFKTVSGPDKEGYSSLMIPKDVNQAQSSIMVYLQDADSGQILAAAKEDLKGI